jgi:superfamily I DNA/RNA helicase
LLAEAITRVRTGRVIRRPGYDGEYGVIRVFADEERSRLGGQRSLFGEAPAPVPTPVKRARGSGEQAKGRVPVPERKTDLNLEQAAAVASGARHILVKAGPGTGKTHTLVQRVVRLASGAGTACTVLTFTNRAADELRQRLSAVLGETMPVMVATLHGFCLHWLRQRNHGLQVAGPEKRAQLLRTLWPGADTEALAALAAEIHDILAAPVAVEPPGHLRPYFARLAAEQLVDIDGVVSAALALLGQDSEMAAAMRRGTGHLLVDEFQDLNEGQYTLIRSLAATSPIFAIGDPDQAIYGFRGASPRWFFRFATDLRAEQHQLWRNYRSGATIVTAAAAVIAKNSHPEGEVDNQAVDQEPGRMHLLPAASAKGEAVAIVRQIEFLLGGSSHREIERLAAPGATYSLSDIAVLYRTGRQAEVLAAALSEQGLPVQVVDLVPFYLSGPVSPLYHWLLLVTGRGENQDLLALLRREPGIGAATLRRVEAHLAEAGADARTLLRRAGEVLPAASGRRLAAMEELLAKVLETARAQGLVPALTLLAGHTGLDPAQPDMNRLLQLAENFGHSLEQFGEHLQRYSDSVVYDPRAEAVTLMTLHAAKGLEFRVVFLAGAEEGLLPLTPRRPLAPEAESEHLAEERRLFYVGLTRAREVLYLCHARSRSMAGRISEQHPSRFLAEIPPHLFSPTAAAPTGKRRRSSVRQLSLFG